MLKIILGMMVFVLGVSLAWAEAPAKAAPAQVEPQAAVLQFDMAASGNVTMDFRDADIKNVLKVLAYKSGTNIIAGPDVVGLVNMQLKDVPWQKALDVVLSTYGYGYEQKGTIIMVTTIDNLKKRREDARALADQEPLATETFILNYGKAEEILKSLEKMKTARGNINFDKRTNAIIMTDVESNIAATREVVRKLDAVTPQVLIEAKIVETTLGKDENMGIKWNLAASAAGAAREITFPFTTTSDNRYMAATTPTGTYTTYGSLDFTHLTSVMNMLQARTDTNVLSTPSIVTLDNQAAKIMVGEQYPVPEYTYNEEQNAMKVSGWSYLDVGIVFNVTPHVNNTGMVTLDIEPSVTDTKGTSSVEGAEMPILTVKSAKTSVMVKDGETLMIAGLIQDKKTETVTKVPLLGDIPFLGLLFKHKLSKPVKTELLIFLTPHIVTAPASLDVPPKK